MCCVKNKQSYCQKIESEIEQYIDYTSNKTLKILRNVSGLEKEICDAKNTQPEDFFDDVAHEFKTPIAVIMGNIEILKSMELTEKPDFE